MKLLRLLPWLLVGLLLAGATASASAHTPALDGLATTLAAMVDAFLAYLGAL